MPDTLVSTVALLYLANVLSVCTIIIAYNVAQYLIHDVCGEDTHSASVGTQTSPDYYASQLRSSEDSGDAVPHDPTSCEWCDKTPGSGEHVSQRLEALVFYFTQTYDVSPTGNKEYAEKSKIGQSAIQSGGRKLVELVFYCKACGASDHICSPAAGLFCPNLKTY